MPDEPLKDPYEVTPETKPETPAFVPPVPIVEGPDPEPPEDPDHADAMQNRGPAILGYTIFLIPLLMAPKSRFARYHANQAVLLFIAAVAAVVLLVILSLAIAILGFVLGHISEHLVILITLIGYVLDLLQIGVVIGLIAMAVLGIINAANLEKKPLPLIGNFTLIKEEPDPTPTPAPTQAQTPAPAPEQPLK